MLFMLIECSECKEKVSDSALVCPSCGTPDFACNTYPECITYKSGAENLFSSRGRLSRARYFWMSLKAGLLVFAATLVCCVILYIAPFDPLIILVYMVAGCGLVLQFMQAAKRFHDMSLSEWYGLLTVIPYLNIAVFLYLCIVEGTPKSNKYGPYKC